MSPTHALIVAAVLAAAPPQDTLEDPPSQPYLAPDPDRSVPTPPANPVHAGFAAVQVNVDGDGMNITNDAANEPSIAVDPTAPNRMAIGWRQFDNIQSSFRQAGVAYTNDGGRTWTSPGVLDPGVFRSDPVLDADLEGTFFYYSLRGNFLCDMYISDDAGVTWTGPIPAYGGDKAWFSVDKGSAAGDGNIFISWSTAAGCCDDDIFTRSLDGGLNYCLPNPVPLSPIWGTVAVGPNGVVYVVGTNGGTHRLVRSIEPSQFIHFDHETDIDLGGVTQAFQGNNSPNPVGLLGQVWVAVHGEDDLAPDDVYVLGSVNPPGPDPMDANFIRSTDSGITWTDPITVNDDDGENWQWMGTMSVAPNGRIDVIFLDTRNSGEARISELFYTSSSDGGTTWSPNLQLSASFDSHVGWPQQNKMGDYFDMVSDDVGAHLAWAATFNGEQDVYYTRIGDYDCNGNGIGDTEDLATGESDDCNGNGIPDECEIAAGTEPDANGNGVPDDCDPDGDVNGDGVVDVLDLIAVILGWGPCEAPGCVGDEDEDGDVDLFDLDAVFDNWDVGG